MQAVKKSTTLHKIDKHQTMLNHQKQIAKFKTVRVLMRSIRQICTKRYTAPCCGTLLPNTAINKRTLQKNMQQKKDIYNVERASSVVSKSDGN